MRLKPEQASFLLVEYAYDDVNGEQLGIGIDHVNETVTEVAGRLSQEDFIRKGSD